jgi:exosortase
MSRRTKTSRGGIETPRAPGRQQSRQKSAAGEAIQQVPPSPISTKASYPHAVWIAGTVLACGVGIWAYWPTLKNIVNTWNTVPDYSHGFLVAPLALVFLWVRRGSYPGIGMPAYGVGLGLLALSLLIRYFGARFYLSVLDGYSIVIWLASVVALVGGRKLLWWMLPSLGFLFFMFPLPFGVETAMSHPLQRVATKLSCWMLQLLGQPAFPDGNVILLGEQQLEVAQACSGLRLFMSVVAIAYAYIAIGDFENLRGFRVLLAVVIPMLAAWLFLTRRKETAIGDEGPPSKPTVFNRRTWWENGVLLASVVPIAIVSNAARIVATGLLFQYTTGETAHKFAHDFAGLAMIVLAGALFLTVLWYLGKLIREEEVMEISALVRKGEA